MNPFQRCGRKIVKTHARKNVRRDVFERCMMYDMDKAIPQRWSSQQPTSHVTTPWCHNRCGLDSVHGLDLGNFPFFRQPVGWWIHFSKSLKWLIYGEKSDFMYNITHMYIIYKWFIVKIQHVIYVYIICSLYQLIQLVVFLASLGSSSRDILVDEKKTRRALRIEICRVLWGKDRHEFVDVHICLYICFV